MKKKVIWIITIIICIIVIIFGIYYVSKNTVTKSVTKHNDIYIGTDLYMGITSINKEGIKLKIFNNTNQEIAYTVDYHIEKYENDKWMSYNVEVNFIDIAKILNPNSSNEEYIKFEEYFKYKKGRYRVIKNINEKTLSAEFDIN